MRLKAYLSFTSLNSAFPLPKIMGLTINRSSSIKPIFIRLDTKVAPPKVSMSFPGCCFIFRISSTYLTIRVIFHATLSRVLERTIWGICIKRGAHRRFHSSSRSGSAKRASQYCSVGRIHPASQDKGVYRTERFIEVSPRLFIFCHCPIEFSIGSFDKTVQRHLQSCNYFSHT